MEQYRLSAPQRLDATVELPASKSISNRALIIYALSGGSHLPENLSDCDDTNVIIKALNEMPEEIDIKAAGTAMRFMTAYLSVTGGTRACWVPTSNTWARRVFPHSASTASSWRAVCWRFQAM